MWFSRRSSCRLRLLSGTFGRSASSSKASLLFCSQVPDQFSLCSPCRLRLLSGTFGRSASSSKASSTILLAGPRPVLAPLVLPPSAPVWDFRAFRLFFQGFFNYSARRSQTSSRAARPVASGSCLGLLGVPPIKIQPVRSGQINLPLTFWLYFCVQNCLISFLRAELFILNFYLKYSTPDSNTFRSCSPQILMATDWPWRSM